MKEKIFSSVSEKDVTRAIVSEEVNIEEIYQYIKKKLVELILK